MTRFSQIGIVSPISRRGLKSIKEFMNNAGYHLQGLVPEVESWTVHGGSITHILLSRGFLFWGKQGVQGIRQGDEDQAADDIEPQIGDLREKITG